LAIQLNLPTIIVDGVLQYKEKLFAWIDRNTGQIQIKGVLCQEYFQVRKLMYGHFGRI
jgi:hypothetical protein